MKLLILDNYDSFVYNLAHMVRTMGINHEVIRNDKISPEDALNFDRIILSPGPGIPSEAGNMPAIIERCANQRPILGVCLGHQGLAEYFGAELKNLEQVVHGRSSMIKQITDNQLFAGLEDEFEVGRYHSWVVDPNTLPDEMVVTAVDKAGVVMAMEHRSLPICGVQFHPESVMTPDGMQMLRNFIELDSSIIEPNSTEHERYS